MLETVCTRRKAIRIAGDDCPAELVKAKLWRVSGLTTAAQALFQQILPAAHLWKFREIPLRNLPDRLNLQAIAKP